MEPTTHRPPVVKFAWGGLSFRCLVERVSGRFTLFLDSGVPVRATLTVALKEYVDPKDAPKGSPTESADHTKTYVVGVGDTLSSIAAAEYGDPGDVAADRRRERDREPADPPTGATNRDPTATDARWGGLTCPSTSSRPRSSVAVNGVMLAPAVANAVTSVVVTHEPDSLDHFTLSVANEFPDLPFTHGDQADLFQEGNSVTIKLGYATRWRAVFDGQVTRVRPTLPGRMTPRRSRSRAIAACTGCAAPPRRARSWT